MRIAVVDSSPLIALAHWGLAQEISQFFDKVLVPRAVQREVNKKARFRYRLNRLFATGKFERCAVADPGNVQLLQEGLNEGEAEALSQAQERRSKEEAELFFIGDERQARDRCQQLKLKAVGTVRLLARLNLDGFADSPAALVRKLRRDLRFRVSEEVVREAIALAAEPI